LIIHPPKHHCLQRTIIFANKTDYMNTTGITDTFVADCPIRNVLSRVASKWSLVVMNNLSDHGTSRFNSLQRQIPDISQKVLTSTLRTLVADGFIERLVYPEVPPRVEYSLTTRGRSFMECAQPLIDWAYNNMSAIINDRNRAD